MPRESREVIYVGIRNVVVALRRSDGAEIWRTKLAGLDFVTVLRDDDGLFVGNRGEVFRLDPRTGAILWHNKLKGLGLGVVSLASDRVAAPSEPPYEALAARRQRQAEIGAATTS